MTEFAELNKRQQVGRLKGLAEKALGDFNVEGAKLTPLWHMENTTFRVDAGDGSRYVLRIQSPRSSVAAAEPTEMQLRSEVEWLAALRRDTELVVPVPVETRDGRLMTIVEVEGVPGARMCVLFEWVYGRFLNKGLRAKHLERVGAYTARLHEHVSTQFVVPEYFTRPRPASLTDEDAKRIVGSFSEVRPKEDVRVVEGVIRRVQEVLGRLGEGPEVFGLIHGDLHQWNYLFERGEVRAIDFDDCGLAHFLYDIAVTLIKLKDRVDYGELRAAYLKGYRGVRELSEDEEGYLDSFFVLRTVKSINWIIEQRKHPAFVGWEEDVEMGMEMMREFLRVQ